MNLNVWKKELSSDEMVQMTKIGGFKCSPMVVRETDLIVRWRDLLHYSTSGIPKTALIWLHVRVMKNDIFLTILISYNETITYLDST